MVNISTWTRTFSLQHPMITTPTPNLLGYRHKWENSQKFCLLWPTDVADNSIQFNSTDIADKKLDFMCIAVLIGDSNSAPPVFSSALKIPTTFYPQKTARFACLGYYSFEFCPLNSSMHKNRQVRSSFYWSQGIVSDTGPCGWSSPQDIQLQRTSRLQWIVH